MSRSGYYDAKDGFVPYDDCPQEKPKPTNADRIRSMTDEELGEFLFSFDECDTTIGSGYSTTYYSQHFCTAPCGGDDTSECLRCITEWLKQEVENV